MRILLSLLMCFFYYVIAGALWHRHGWFECTTSIVKQMGVPMVSRNRETTNSKYFYVRNMLGLKSNKLYVRQPTIVIDVWTLFINKLDLHFLPQKKKKKIPTWTLMIHLFFGEKQNVKRLFGLSFLITQFSVSITHNSKMVGPIAKSLFGKQ